MYKSTDSGILFFPRLNKQVALPLPKKNKQVALQLSRTKKRLGLPFALIGRIIGIIKEFQMLKSFSRCQFRGLHAKVSLMWSSCLFIPKGTVDRLGQLQLVTIHRIYSAVDSFPSSVCFSVFHLGTESPL